jgi:hypothetical protein
MNQKALTPEEQELRRKLDNLGAYRLLQHFHDDWRAAQAHSAKVRGKNGPLFKGKKAWRLAAREAQREIGFQAMMPSADCLDREIRTNPKFRTLFPGVTCASDLPPYLSLTKEQIQLINAVLRNADRARRQ